MPFRIEKAPAISTMRKREKANVREGRFVIARGG